MKKLLNIRYLLSAMVLALCLFSACNGNNKKDEELSTDLVTNPKSATQPSEKQPMIVFDKTEHDFGTILQGEVVTYSFHFTNTGSSPLIISNVNTSCGCTVGDFPVNLLRQARMATSRPPTTARATTESNREPSP